MEKMKWLCSIVAGMIATFLNQYGVFIVLVLVAIVFDVVTGLIKASIHGDIDSKKARIGFLGKIALFICLFFGFFLDYSIPYLCSRVSIDIPFNMPFGLIICFYIVLNEGISCCENLYACNPSIMPKWIVNILKSAKEQIDNEDVKEE